MRITTFVCFTLTAWLTACAGGPAYQRPDVTLPAQWQSGATAAAAAPVTTAWWSDFRSPELDRLITAALDGNRDLKAAGARMAQARALAQIAGANLAPSLAASADVALNKGAGAQRATQHSAGVGAGFELDLWGKNRQSHEAAISRVQSSVHARQAVTLALQAEVAATYFQLLSAHERVAVAQTTLGNAESVLRLLQVQHKAGAVSGLEVVRQQGLVASVKADIAPIEQQRQQASAALAVLLGRHPQDLALSATPLSAVRLPQVDAGLPSTLLEQRPDIRQAEADLLAANADINAARAALFPSIKLTASGGVESASLVSLLRSGSLAYTLAAGLSAPLFDGGRLRAQVALTQARQDELVQVYQQSILRALREVEDSLSAVQRLSEQAANQQDVVAHAVAAQSMAELRFRNGAVDFATTLDAQRVLLSAQAAQQTITLSRYAAVVGLYRALGGGWQALPQPLSQPLSQVSLALPARAR
jgi:outer membrane protein, multidrug efflux system